MSTGVRRLSDRISFISAKHGVIHAGNTTTGLLVPSDIGAPIQTYFETNDITGAVRAHEIGLTTKTAATASQVEALRVELISDVKTGVWANAIMAQVDYQDSGAAHGMAATICAEMIPPNSSLARGALYALDLEFGCGASSSWGSAGPVAFVKMENWGTATHFSANAFLLHLAGETGAAGALLSATELTLKSRIGSNTRYLMMSHYEDSLSIGLTGSRKTMVTGVPEIVVWETNGLLTGTQDLVKLDLNHTGTCTAGYVKVLRATLTSTGYLPSSAKVLYASLTVAAAGSIGYAAGIATDVTLPNASLAHGAVYGLDIQLIGQASTDFSSAGPVAAIHFNFGGTVTEFDSDGFLFVIDGVSEGDGKLCDNGGTPAEADGGIRFRLNGNTRYLLYANDAEN